MRNAFNTFQDFSELNSYLDEAHLQSRGRMKLCPSLHSQRCRNGCYLLLFLSTIARYGHSISQKSLCERSAAVYDGNGAIVERTLELSTSY
eukprot:COSAG05_NODE_203_length_14207_cov_24.645379_3_plen_91_part_00